MTKLESKFGARVNKSKATKHFPMNIKRYPSTSPLEKHQKYNAFLERMYQRNLIKYKSN